MEEIEKIKKDIQLVKREIDALQVAILSSRTPWYKNITIIISILALAFSFGTTYVSNERIKTQDIQNLKSDLRNMLQRLAVLPSENLEVTKKYANDPQAINYFSAQLNQENSLLAVQAAELVSKLPTDKVSSIELYSIALALQFSYQYEKAKEFFQLSYDLANDMNVASSAKRGSANMLFLSGQAEAGRIEFQQALNVFSFYEGYNDYTQKNIHILTLLNWAGAEAGIGFIDHAIQKIKEAENIANSMVPSSLTNQLIGQIRQTKQTLKDAGYDLGPMDSVYGEKTRRADEPMKQAYKQDDHPEPSFNCAKASTKTEKSICKNSELSHADRRMFELYSQLRKSLSKSDAKWLRKKQHAWLKKRNTCYDDVNCLLEVYEERISELTK